MSQKIYDMVAERIMAELERGTVPWRKPWACGPENGEGGAGPRNIVSGRHYRGVNSFVLACSGFSSPWWMTYRQAAAKGGHVKKGERGSPVIFWKFLDARSAEGEEGEAPTAGRKRGRIPLLRYFTVFNLEQCEGVKAPEAPASTDPRPAFAPLEQAERIAAGMPSPPSLGHGGDRACYMPSRDHVQMPPREAFGRPEHYYLTLFHELTHSTGHASRLSREGILEGAPFGSAIYSREELVAEMGAAFLAAAAGINDTVPHSAAYIAGWLKEIKRDPRAVVVAAGKAQKAADFILNRKQEEEKPEGEGE